MSIANEWDAFLRRRVFLSDHLAFALGNSEPVKCSAFSEFVASLLLVDLVSVLDSAVQERIKTLGLRNQSNLAARIALLQKHRSLRDPSGIDSIRRTRNTIAHEARRLEAVELAGAIDLVEKELQDWGMIGVRPNYVAFMDTSAWRERPTGRDLEYERNFTIGVRVAETGAPVLAYEYNEYAHDPASPFLRMSIEEKGVGAI